jgi:hypothetical protein
MLPVTTEGDCHLIPKCIKYGDPTRPVSNRTVRLDGPFDNKIGEKCDHNLKAYLDLLIAGCLKMDASFEGGAQKIGVTLECSTGKVRIKLSTTLSVTLELTTGKVLIESPPGCRRWKQPPPEDGLRKALGMGDDGLIKITGAVGHTVDIAMARLSMINSAFLVLYYSGRRDFGREFGWASALLQKAVESDLEESDVRVTEQFTEVVIQLATEKLQGHVPTNPAEFRNHYRRDVDMPDGVLEDFPNNCVAEDDEALVVRLPYGKGLRGVVRFPKKP